jgi:hypothetical protein
MLEEEWKWRDVSVTTRFPFTMKKSSVEEITPGYEL